MMNKLKTDFVNTFIYNKITKNIFYEQKNMF